MTEYNKAPVFYIRSWISSELLNSGIIDQADYNNIDPVVPVQDIERTSESLGKLPYIVYSYSLSPVQGDKFFVKEEMLYLSVFSVNFSELVSIGAFIIDMLDRQDLTAADINSFSDIDNINFKTVQLTKSEVPVRMEEVQGRYMHTMCFCYKYTRSMKNNGRFAF